MKIEIILGARLVDTCNSQLCLTHAACVAGTVPTGGTPDEFATFIKREVAKWAEVIKGANIKAD